MVTQKNNTLLLAVTCHVGNAGAWPGNHQFGWLVHVLMFAYTGTRSLRWVSLLFCLRSASQGVAFHCQLLCGSSLRLAQPAGRSDWPAENYPVRTHIATPESITPFCYISPDWTNPCFLRIAQCNTSCDWMALVIFICVRHLAGISVRRSWTVRQTGRDLCRQVWRFFVVVFSF